MAVLWVKLCPEELIEVILVVRTRDQSFYLVYGGNLSWCTALSGQSFCVTTE